MYVETFMVFSLCVAQLGLRLYLPIQTFSKQHINNYGKARHECHVHGVFTLAGIFLAGARNCIFFLTSVNTLANSCTNIIHFVCAALCRKTGDQRSLGFLLAASKNTTIVNRT